MTINRRQALVLGFFVVVRASLVAISAAAPEVYQRATQLSSFGAGLLFLLGVGEEDYDAGRLPRPSVGH